MRDAPLIGIRGLPQILHNCRVKSFPDGSSEIMVSDRAIFREPEWRASDDRAEAREKTAINQRKIWESLEEPIDAAELDDSALWRWEERDRKKGDENLARAKRRAKAAVRDLALSNDFRFFVTLTLDPGKIDRYNEREVTRKLNTWLDNAVRRQGLKYVLVAERHKDGAIHFHGFFNDALEAVDSGTIKREGEKKPRKPRSARQRAAWLAEGGHVVYNLPRWSWGFTTAIELYGQRRAAVGYVCKYIAKEQEKVGGRWYYSGGSLRRPEVTFSDVDFECFRGLAGAFAFDIDALGAQVVKLWTEGGEDVEAAGCLRDVRRGHEAAGDEAAVAPGVPGGDRTGNVRGRYGDGAGGKTAAPGAVPHDAGRGRAAADGRLSDAGSAGAAAAAQGHDHGIGAQSRAAVLTAPSGPPEI